MDSILQRELSNQPFQKEEAPQEQENGWFWQLMKTSATLGVLLLGFGFTKLVKFRQNLPRQQYSAMQLYILFRCRQGDKYKYWKWLVASTFSLQKRYNPTPKPGKSLN